MRRRANNFVIILVHNRTFWFSPKKFGRVQNQLNLSPKCFGPKKDLGKIVFYSIYADWTVGDRKSQFLGEGLMFSYILFWGQARITCTTYTLVTVYYVSNKYVLAVLLASFSIRYIRDQAVNTQLHKKGGLISESLRPWSSKSKPQSLFFLLSGRKV